MDQSLPGHLRILQARGVTRQAIDAAGHRGADLEAILGALHGIAPNRKSRTRIVRRLRRLSGVVRAGVTRDGIALVLRGLLRVTLIKDGETCRTEPRIAWTSVEVTAGGGRVGFALRQVQVTGHAIQRLVERTFCRLEGLLEHLDRAMLRALSRLDAGASVRDRDDEFIPEASGAWAGGVDAMDCDPSWGPAFSAGAPPIPVFSIHTFLGEDQLRPTVWLACSRAAAVA